MRVPMKNGLEWTVFALGLAMVLATLGFLGWDAANHLLTGWGRRGHDLWSPPLSGLLAR